MHIPELPITELSVAAVNLVGFAKCLKHAQWFSKLMAAF